ncbi:MAG: HEAT repeat domain-containing protein [Planctomycetota bacterium]
MRCLVLAGIIAFVAGCGAAPDKSPVAAPTSKPPGVKAVAKPDKPPVEPPAPVAANAFADIAAAVEALKQAVTSSNSEEFATAQAWLQQQKAAAIPAVTELVRDEQAHQFARTAGCKILAQIGPEATQTLLDLSQSDSQRVRQVAIQELGNIRPASEQVIDTLIELTSGTDTETRSSAIAGLKHIGPPAAKAADALVAILNNTDEPEALRTSAKSCLKEVNPRKTFSD